MITPQLIDYIKGQMQKGASSDTIKTELAKAGWSQSDINEGMGIINAPKTSVPAAAPASPAVANPVSQFPAVSPVKPSQPSQPVAAKSIDIKPSQPIMEGESISFSAPDLQTMDMPAVRPPAAAASAPFSVKSQGGGNPSFSIQKFIPLIVVGVVAIAAAGAAIYFYTQAGAGSAKAQTLSTQVTALQTQLAALNAQNQSLNTQIASLTADNANLDSQLSLFASPPGSSTSTQEVPMTVKGAISLSNATYFLTTSKNIIFAVKNSKDGAVQAALHGLIGAEAELSGMHAPASRLMTVQKVNGNALTAPAPAATSTSPSAKSVTPPSQSTGTATGTSVR